MYYLEKQSKMGRLRHCLKEEHPLIKKSMRKTYKQVQKMIGCSTKRVLNALKGDCVGMTLSEMGGVCLK